jgi:hypothetical protein
LTIAAPNTNSNFTLTLPTETGTIITNSGNQAGSFTTLNTSGAVVFNDAGADVDFRVEGDTEANLLFVDASADKVGIGTSSPDYKLDVSSADNVVAKFNYSGGASGYVYADANIVSYGSSTSGGNAINFYDSLNLIRLYTDGSERMRINSSGALLVGTTSSGSGVSHTFAALSTASDRLPLVLTHPATTAGVRGLRVVFANSSDGGGVFIDGENSLGTRFFILSSGDIQNVNNSYGAISDAKLKQDIIDAGSQWDDIKNLRVRKFRFKSEPDSFMQIGLVAQEVEEVSPGLIQERQDISEETHTREVEKTREVEVTPAVLDEDGNVIEPAVMETETYTEEEEYTETVDLGTTTKSVKYSILYMKAVKALQEAMERIEALEANNAALEARITAIENGA